MADPQKDPLSPGGKDPVEGARGPDSGAGPDGALDESHLGAGGDPVEGKPEEE
jgi:hypothetical protein